MTLASLWKRVSPLLRNKYLLTIAIFIIWMLLFDSSNWVDVLREHNKIRKLKAEKEFYLQKIENDRNRLKELQTDTDNLEKFAREQYLMKKSNEDVFVVMPD